MEYKPYAITDKLIYKGLVGSVQYSRENQIFFGKIQWINDMVPFEGNTLDELEKGFHFMVDEHILETENNSYFF